MLLGPHVYSMGEEIKGYPIGEMAISIIYWKTTEQFSYDTAYWAENGTTFVLYNFTIRNLGNTELNLMEYDLRTRLDSVDPPMLKYGSYYASDSILTTMPWSWKYRLFTGEPSTLMPNQSTMGFLIYRILDGYQPTQLTYPNGDSPQFIIETS